MILLDAVFVHSMGGRRLLAYLSRRLEAATLPVHYLLDSRHPPLPVSPERQHVVEPGLRARHAFYRSHRHALRQVLCLGNVPPGLRLKAPVHTYFQNMLLLRQPGVQPLMARMMLQLKARLIRRLSHNTDAFIVQTPYVQQALARYLQWPPERIGIIPFFEAPEPGRMHEKEPYSFLYPAAGYGYKNHERLLQAWPAVQQALPEASLRLTIAPAYNRLIQQIATLQDQGYRIFNTPRETEAGMQALYDQSSMVIYPSLMESLGLGLVEGHARGCALITADLPWAHAVCKPDAVFDPLDAAGMARAMLQQASRPAGGSNARLLVTDEAARLVDWFRAG